MKKVLFILLITLTIFITGCININPGDNIQSKSLVVGEVVELQVSDAKSFESSNDSIATVTNDGLVTGVSVGNCTIKITTQTKEYSIKIIVNENIKNVSMRVTSKQTIKIGEEVKLECVVDNTTDNYVFSYFSSDEQVATIDQFGVVKGINEGIAQITIKVTGTIALSKEVLIYVYNENKQTTQENTINVNVKEVIGSIDLTSLNDKVKNVINSNKESIFGVTNYQYVQTYSGQQLTAVSIGTGFIFKKEVKANGYLYYAITNQHVVKDNAKLRVYFGYEDIYYDAEEVASNALLDLAVIKFESEKEYVVLEISDTKDISQGDFAIAIGCANGYEYFGSVTFGIVSYVNRTLSGEDATFIQHDVAINPGCSGGPLLDINGKVIGVNTLKIINSEIDSMCFSISCDTVKKFLETVTY